MPLNIQMQFQHVYLFQQLCLPIKNLEMKEQQSLALEKKTETIEISIQKPGLKSELAGVNKYYLYPIVGSDQKGSFNTVRKYSDFEVLRKVLTVRWPGCLVPSLPNKKLAPKNSDASVQLCREGLQTFLMQLSKMTHFWESEEVQIFLKENGECEKPISALKQISIEQILINFKKYFGHLRQKECPKQVSESILQFSHYLQNSMALLEKLQKVVSEALSKRNHFNDCENDVLEWLIPEYEKNCSSFYSRSKGFDAENTFILTRDDGSTLPEKLESVKAENKVNPIIYILFEISQQKAETNAFGEVMKTRDKYSAVKQKLISKIKDKEIDIGKVNQGKESLIAKITKKTKEEQLIELNNELQEKKNQEQNLTTLYEYITVIIGCSEIRKFKQLRERAYFSTLKRFFKYEKEQSSIKKHFWMEVLKSDHLKEKVVELNKKEVLIEPIQQEKKKKPKKAKKEKSQKKAVNDNSSISEKGNQVQKSHQQKQQSQIQCFDAQESVTSPQAPLQSVSIEIQSKQVTLQEVQIQSEQTESELKVEQPSEVQKVPDQQEENQKEQ